MKLPLKLKGVISYLPVRTPTLKEIDECLTLEATAENVEWEPYSLSFEEEENACKEEPRIPMIHRHMHYLSTENHDISDTIIQNADYSSLITEKKTLYVASEELARKWAIGTTLAEATIKATTQRFIQSSIHPIDRPYWTKNTNLKYNVLNCRFTSDTFFSSTPSILRNTCAQLFMSDFGFGKVCPQKFKSEAGTSLQEFIQDIGIPRHLHTDNAKEMTLGTWARVCKDAVIKTTTTEADSPGTILLK